MQFNPEDEAASLALCVSLQTKNGWALKQPMANALKALEINIITIRGINVIHMLLYNKFTLTLPVPQSGDSVFSPHSAFTLTYTG